jgi:hypothetical protein
MEDPFVDTPMIQESFPAPGSAPNEYSDRSTLLTVLGIGEILLGTFALLGIPLILLGAVLARKTMGAMPAGSYAQSVASYLAAAIILITLGTGSIQAKRWARALNLVAAWVGLIGGVVTTITMTAALPAEFLAGMRAAAERNPEMPPMSRGLIAAGLTAMIVLFAVLFVAMPLVYVIFLSRKDVEETCRRRDPVERWTDRRPLPLLAVSLIFGSRAAYYLAWSLTTPLMPFFGRYLVGFAGGVAGLVAAALDLLLAVVLYRGKIAAWWAAVGLLVLRGVSAGITFSRGNLLEAYSRLGWSGRQLAMMSSNPALRSGTVMWISLVYIVILLGYLIWIKTYFGATASGKAGEEPQANSAVPS